jgi:hypothetical protein
MPEEQEETEEIEEVAESNNFGFDLGVEFNQKAFDEALGTFDNFNLGI